MARKVVRKVVIVGFPVVQALDVVGPYEVFTGASILTSGGYDVVVASIDGRPVTTGSGLAFVTTRLPDPSEPVDTVVLPGGGGVDVARSNREILGWIRAVAGNARRVVSVCTGAFLVAEAGLLDGCRATTHWAFAGRLAREFPTVDVDPEPIFIRSSETVWTAAGVTAGIDLALSLVEDDHGTEVAQTVTADSGVLVIGATHSLAETPSPDVVLVPGGPSTPVHARDETLLDWLRRVHRTADWTTSVCSGSVILAAAGILEGRRATSHWLTIPALKAFGAIPVSDERIVRQGNVVTSAGVSAGLDLALWLAAQIGGEGRAKAIQLAIEYDPQPPFDSGHMSKASATTKAAATALLSRDSVKPANLKATTLLAWQQALAAVRSRRRSRQPVG